MQQFNNYSYKQIQQRLSELNDEALVKAMATAKNNTLFANMNDCIGGHRKIEACMLEERLVGEEMEKRGLK